MPARRTIWAFLTNSQPAKTWMHDQKTWIRRSKSPRHQHKRFQLLVPECIVL
jgi:hypothetical protein